MKERSGSRAAVDERYAQWKSLIPVLYDWFANHNLVWPSLSCRWGPQFEKATYKNRQRLYLSEQTDGSVPNTLVIANCEVVKPRVAAAEHISQFNEEARSPFVKKYKTIVHPGEVNRIRELPQNSKIIATHTDSPDVLIWDVEAQPNRHAVLGATESRPDLILTGHQENAEFALAMCPAEPYVLSGGKDKSVVLWSIQDHISALGDSSSSPGASGSKQPGKSANEKESPKVDPRGIFHGHDSTVEDVQFCPSSAQEFCSVGDDACLIPRSNLPSQRPPNLSPRRVQPATTTMASLAAHLAVPAAALLFLFFAAPASAANFTCATPGATCQSAIGYKVPNATTYAGLVARFNTTTTLPELLGANSLPAGTSSSAPIAANTTLRIPFRCLCGSNMVGQSDGGPIYVVQPQDGLYAISHNVFDDFVTYQEVAAANNIPDPNKIDVGQKLKIPLPCTCDQVDGADVMHLAYSVPKGDNTSAIAAKFGVKEQTLLNLNKIADPKDLKQEQILDVPLPVCRSSISSTSADHNLLLPNGTYALTAGGCMQCSCNANNYEQLSCSPVQRGGCPAVPACDGGLKLGSTNGTGCESKMCAYTGYSNTTSLSIHTALVTANQTACQQKGGAARSEFAGSMWRMSAITFHMVLILVCFL